MRAYRAVWSPIGAYDQRKRPHKLPDRNLKELTRGACPPAEAAHYTHANPPIKQLPRRAAAFRKCTESGCPPGPTDSTVVRRDTACGMGRSAERRKPSGMAPAPMGVLSMASRGYCRRGFGSAGLWSVATLRLPPHVRRAQFAVATAVRVVRSSLANNGLALD